MEAETEVDRLEELSRTWVGDLKPGEEEEKNVANVQAKLSGTTVQVEMKLQSAQGLELKELRTVFGRLKNSQRKLDKVKEAIREQSKVASQRVVKDAAVAVKEAETRVNQLAASAAAPGQLTLPKLESLVDQSSEVMELVSEARRVLSKGQTPQLMLEAKVEFARLQLRCKATERKAHSAADALRAQYDKVTKDVTGQALDALRSAARGPDGKYDPVTLFAELAENGNEVTEKQFCDFFGKRRDAGEETLSAERAQLALKKIAPHGLAKRAFVAAMADFLKVARDITITDEFEIQAAKKLRKL